MFNDSGHGNVTDCVNCPCYDTQQAWENYHTWYQTAASCLGVLANALILVTLLAGRVSHSCHVYVLALTLADLGYSTCRILIFHFIRLPESFWGLWQCRALLTAHNLCRGVANWVMVLLAADRLRVVAAPLTTHAKGRRLRWAAGFTCTACLAALAMNLPRLVHFVGYAQVLEDGRLVLAWCYLLKTDLALALRGLELALTFHAPVVGNAGVNLVLCACIWRGRQRRKRMSHQAASTSADDAERQVTRMLVATSLMHSCFSLPMACLEIVNLKETFVRTTNYFLYLCINYAFGVFYSWHTFVNLPIYLVYNSTFRAQFLRLLLPCWRRNQRDGSQRKTTSGGGNDFSSAARQGETSM